MGSSNQGVNLALVILGGAVGTGLRALIEASFPAEVGAWPWQTFAINLVGALLLGALLELLLPRLATGQAATPSAPRQALRFALGTGLLGGFTTYSSFALEMVGLAASGRPWLGLGYGLVSVVTGFTAALFAMTLVARLRSRAAA